MYYVHCRHGDQYDALLSCAVCVTKASDYLSLLFVANVTNGSRSLHKRNERGKHITEDQNWVTCKARFLSNVKYSTLLTKSLAIGSVSHYLSEENFALWCLISVNKFKLQELSLIKVITLSSTYFNRLDWHWNRLRGHQHMLVILKARLDIRGYGFSPRIVSTW